MLSSSVQTASSPRFFSHRDDDTRGNGCGDARFFMEANWAKLLSSAADHIYKRSQHLIKYVKGVFFPETCFGSYLDFTKIHLFLDGVHLLRPLHPQCSVVAALDQLLSEPSQQWQLMMIMSFNNKSTTKSALLWPLQKEWRYSTQPSRSENLYLADGMQWPNGSKVLCCLVGSFLADCLQGENKGMKVIYLWRL